MTSSASLSVTGAAAEAARGGSSAGTVVRADNRRSGRQFMAGGGIGGSMGARPSAHTGILGSLRDGRVVSEAESLPSAEESSSTLDKVGHNLPRQSASGFVAFPKP